MAYPTVYETNFNALKFRYRGKVRDVYDIDEESMLIIATDRLSAFDVIMPTPIPEKGVLLTQLSNFWFNKFKDLVPNHLLELDLPSLLPDQQERQQAEARSMRVRKLNALPIEAVVRGYLIGSGWKDYQATGSVCGIKLPSGLELAQQLPEPLFTPSSKAAVGDHDENISYAAVEEKIGIELAEKIKNISIELYKAAADYASGCGIIIADTKFEFGLDKNGQLFLIDEVLTPDSSRFWPKEFYQPGENPPSYDKQFVRDYLETQGWNKQAPGPIVPSDIIEKTAEKYREAVARLIRD